LSSGNFSTPLGVVERAAREHGDENPELAQIAALGDQFLWWPLPELNARIEFKLINPVTGQTLFCAGPESSYWLAKWMNDGSYARYKLDAGGNPPFAVNYVLEYRVNGKTYPRW